MPGQHVDKGGSYIVRVLLGPQSNPLDSPNDLATFYPWPAGGWVRAMMAMSLDGSAVGPDGRSRSISAGPDRILLSDLRSMSDVVLVGASTIRVERYRPMIAVPACASARSALGLAPAPVVTIVSASLDLPWQEAMFHESTIRPIVVTVESADRDRLLVAERHAQVIRLPGENIDLGIMLMRLREVGLTRIVCEGGPRLLAQLVAEDLIDEADITLSPVFTGGGQWSSGTPFALPSRFRLAHVINDEDFLFMKYLRSETRPEAIHS
jgi:riboflavin biosynthesis pyrimidine reductase